MSKSKQRFKSEAHNVFLEKVNNNNIALSVSDDKRLKTCDEVILYLHGTGAGKGKTNYLI